MNTEDKLTTSRYNAIRSVHSEIYILGHWKINVLIQFQIFPIKKARTGKSALLFNKIKSIIYS